MPAQALAKTSDYAHRAQKAAAMVKRGDAKPAKVTKRLRDAIAAMVFEGQTRAEAAETAGITDDGLRKALLKPAVLAHLNEQMEVLRTGARPRALQRIIKLADRAESERVQLDAARYLDGMDRNGNTVGAQQVNVQVNNTVNVESPGYVIRLERRADRPVNEPHQIEHLETHGHNPLIHKPDVPEEP